MRGEVKWFNPLKGYGFISLEDGRDVFVHYTDIIKTGFQTLWEGQKVSCDVEARPQDEKKLKAINVVVVDDADWKQRYPFCPICNGSGFRGETGAICHPCQGKGVVSLEACYTLYCAANAAAERRYAREQEWKRKYRKNKSIWKWIKNDYCSASCRKSKKRLRRQIKKQGRHIKFYRRAMRKQ